jgi:hypothetical protein
LAMLPHWTTAIKTFNCRNLMRRLIWDASSMRPFQK